jgi:hypothetical protein
MKKPTTSKASTDSEVNTFDDFIPVRSNDGSYKGTMKAKEAREDHLQRKFDERLVEVKARLKAAKCKVGLSVRGSSIQLQATLPDKPDGTKGKPWQQLISLGIPASLDGLKTAEEEAYELGRLLARKQFTWTEKYLGKNNETSNQPEITIDFLIENYEKKYFKTREIAETTKHSFYKDLAMLRRAKRYGVQIFNQTEIDKFLESIESKSSKEGIVVAFRTVAATYQIPLNIVRPKRDKPRIRIPPGDEQIVSGYFLFKKRADSVRFTSADNSDNWIIWEWVYGMIAAYGLRPRELFMCPDLDWWLSAKNDHHTWRVHEDTKTGYREALPLHQDWVLLFDLKNENTIQLFKEYMKSRVGFIKADSCVGNFARWLSKLEIGFAPYDLRHAWAIRAHMMGIPIKAAADNLGHSVEMHTRTYQRWFSLENRIQSMDAAIAKKTEVDLLKDEVAKLTLEVERLKIELERSRLINKGLP